MKSGSIASTRHGITVHGEGFMAAANIILRPGCE